MNFKHQLITIILLFTTGINTLFINSTSEFWNDTSASASSISNEVFNAMARAADYASLSYLTQGNLLKLGNIKDACLCTLCTDSYSGVSVEKIYSGIVSGVILKDDYRREIILSIKGTTTNTEWLLDFNFTPIPYRPFSRSKNGWKKYLGTNKECKNCGVHRGFYDAAKIIYDNLFPTLLKLSNENLNYKIVLTGHSLGGALAPFIATECLLMGKYPTVVTFGAPKIGNSKFSSWMDEIWETKNNYASLDAGYIGDKNPTYFRVTHRGDYVPLVPTQQMGYRHCGIDIYFNINELPFDTLQVELKNSPSRDMTTKEFNELKNSIEEYNKVPDTHLLYFIKMNQCYFSTH